MESYRTFAQLAPIWNKKLQEFARSSSRKKSIPELAKMSECIIHECVENTYNEFKGINKLPNCFMCNKIATSSPILEMAYSHYGTSLKERIKSFYEYVPQIEKHFREVHSN